MTLKPEIVSQTLVIEQVKELTDQRYKLNVQIEQLENRLKLIEASIAENGELAGRVNALLAESLGLFEEEWRNRSALFPDLWLSTLEQSLLFANPLGKKR